MKTKNNKNKLSSFPRMQFCALASGSSGNCFYVEKDGDAVLIDCGIASKQINEKLASIKKTSEKIKGIFVTHEHIDHIRGIDVFSANYNIPIYLTKKTSESSFICRNEQLINIIKNNESINIGKLRIQAFPKSHDGSDPISYSIETKDKRLSVITDIGYACKNVVDYVSRSDALILESNHDIFMLQNGPYPDFLKKKIASDYGHISNYHAALLVLNYASKKLKNIMLSHLSINNNTPEIALKTFKLLKERKDIKPKIHLSLREKPSDYINLK